MLLKIAWATAQPLQGGCLEALDASRAAFLTLNLQVDGLLRVSNITISQLFYQSEANGAVFRFISLQTQSAEQGLSPCRGILFLSSLGPVK
jgi:hypothetical protein